MGIVVVLNAHIFAVEMKVLFMFCGASFTLDFSAKIYSFLSSGDEPDFSQAQVEFKVFKDIHFLWKHQLNSKEPILKGCGFKMKMTLQPTSPTQQTGFIHQIWKDEKAVQTNPILYYYSKQFQESKYRVAIKICAAVFAYFLWLHTC